MGKQRGKYADQWDQRRKGVRERLSEVFAEHPRYRGFHAEHAGLLEAVLRKLHLAGEKPGPELRAFLDESLQETLAEKQEDEVEAKLGLGDRDENVDPATVPVPTDEDLRNYVHLVRERDAKWAASIRKFASALTDAEKEHAIAYATDREYRRRGDSKMAVVVRRCDKVVRQWTTEFVQRHRLTGDRALMQVYLDMRRATKMFSLSPDDQEAFDLSMDALDRFPTEMARALRERGVDVA